MAKTRTGGTRNKLLSAASAVFVEKGYRDATVAEICRRSKANISAVNYYFGSKEELYRQSWQHSFAESMKAHPPDGGVSETAPAEERLRGRVTALMERIADPSSTEFFISQMELVNPTGLLEQVMKSELIPMREKMLELVRELLGGSVEDRQVSFCEVSIVSMCINPILMRRIRSGHAEAAGLDDLKAFADHVVNFSLAGIAGIRGQH